MAGPVRAAAQGEMHTAFEQPIQDGLGQVAIMHHIAQGRHRFVCRQQDRAVSEIAFVDDAIDDVGPVGRMREVAEFVDDEVVWLETLLECGISRLLRRITAKLAVRSRSGRRPHTTTDAEHNEARHVHDTTGLSSSNGHRPASRPSAPRNIRNSTSRIVNAATLT